MNQNDTTCIWRVKFKSSLVFRLGSLKIEGIFGCSIEDAIRKRIWIKRNVTTNLPRLAGTAKICNKKPDGLMIYHQNLVKTHTHKISLEVARDISTIYCRDFVSVDLLQFLLISCQMSPQGVYYGQLGLAFWWQERSDWHWQSLCRDSKTLAINKAAIRHSHLVHKMLYGSLAQGRDSCV